MRSIPSKIRVLKLLEKTKEEVDEKLRFLDSVQTNLRIKLQEQYDELLAFVFEKVNSLISDLRDLKLGSVKSINLIESLNPKDSEYLFILANLYYSCKKQLEYINQTFDSLLKYYL